MPVYKSYVNDNGNYIRARPPDTGNITYQTTPEAEDFIQKLGYTHDDDLPWGIINPLRAAGLIYTEGQGTDQGLDDAPELDPSELATMSADEAEKLLSYLQSRGDVPDEVYDQLRETIEANQKDGLEKLVDQVPGFMNVEYTPEDDDDYGAQLTVSNETFEQLLEPDEVDNNVDKIIVDLRDEVEKLVDALDSHTPESMDVSKMESTSDDRDVEITITHSVDRSWERHFHTIGILIESPNDEYDHRIMQWNVGLPTPDRSDPNIEKMTALNESKREIMRAMASLDGRSFDSRFSQHNRINYAYVDYE